MGSMEHLVEDLADLLCSVNVEPPNLVEPLIFVLGDILAAVSGGVYNDEVNTAVCGMLQLAYKHHCIDTDANITNH